MSSGTSQYLLFFALMFVFVFLLTQPSLRVYETMSILGGGVGSAKEDVKVITEPSSNLQSQ